MLNKVVLMGRLVRDPELRVTQSGVPVASFTLAVDRSYTKEGAEKETDFLNCVAWRGTAEFVSRYFKKGMQAAVCGRIQTRKWKDQQDQKRVSVEIVADEVFFADSAPEPSPPGVVRERDEKQGAPAGAAAFSQATEQRRGEGDVRGVTSAAGAGTEPGGWQSRDVSFEELGDEDFPF